MAQRITQTFNFALGSTGFWGFDLDNGVAGALLFEPASPAAPQPSLINFGTMNYSAPLASVTSTAFITFSSTSQWDQALIENHGEINATTSNVDQVFAIRATSSSPNLANTGQIFASAGKSAIAFESWDLSLTISNTGAIGAIASQEAIGIHAANGASITESGNVSAWANGGPGVSVRAIGILVSNSGNNTTIVNSLVIEAKDFDPTAAKSFGIHYAGNLVLVNNGIIRGDYAIYENSAGGPLPIATVLNNGTLEGHVLLADGNDLLENNGTIQGNVDLGQHDDTYNGQLGTVTGDVLGGGGNDQLTGGSAVDRLFGGDGDDRIEGGASGDQINGGIGFDVASYASSTAGVLVTLGSPTAPGAASGGDAAGDTLTGIEGLLGSAFDDQLFGSGTGVTISGGAGNDILRGEDPFHLGPGGNDTLNGGDGNDYMNGGAGVDSYDGGTGTDRVSFFAAAATQGAVASLITQTISNDGFGNAETMVSIESLGAGTAFADTFTGNDLANELYASLGDTVIGNGGDDTFIVSGRPAFMDGGAGIDTLVFNSDAGTLFPDNNGDGLAEFVLANHGVGVELNGALLSDDGFTFSGIFGQFTGFENITGTSFSDALGGDEAANVLSGRGGFDLLVGNGGDDTLLGGDGDDYLSGGAGIDALDGGAGLDVADYSTSPTNVTIDLQNGIRTGGHATGDTFVSIEGALGSDFDDTLAGDGQANTLRGGNGNDFLQGRAGSDFVDGGDGDDWLDGGAGADTITGGDFDVFDRDMDIAAYGGSAAAVNLDLQANTYSGGDAAGDTLTGIEGLSGSGFNDQLFGDAIGNRLFGQGGADFIQGRGGNDLIDGGDGDDWLDGGAGADQIFGGNGTNDIVAYGASTAAVNADLAAFTFTGGDAAGDTYSGVEGVSGSAFNDQLFGDGNANRLFGQGGADFIQGRGGNDLIDGGDGDDWLDGGAGADQIFGGNGTNDIVAYGASTAAVNADLAAFTFTGGDAAGDTYSGVEGVSGSAFGDQLFGDANANRLFGQGGNDFIQGRGGNDLIDGGDGDDWLDGGAGGDQIFGGNGTNDVVAYGASTAAVNADLQSFTFSGGDAAGDTYSGIEGVSGSAFNDNLSGDANANRLLGQGGTDILAGRGGNDYLEGGTANDTFVFADNGGVDNVADFDDFGDDIIQLTISGITSFAQVQAVMTQSGANVLIDFATTDILLLNTTLASMGADDFTFV